MSNKFIMISNQFFESTNRHTLFKNIGTEGFTLYSYLLYQQGSNTSLPISIKMIQTFLNREYKNRPDIQYNNKKSCKVSCLKDKDTIATYMNTLYINKLINIHNYNDLKDSVEQKLQKCNKHKEFKMNMINVNQIMIIECNSLTDEKQGFEAMPADLFRDYIYKIGHVGWGLLCYLSRMHNYSYGNQDVGNYGFANPNEDDIAKILDRGTNTIKAYLKLLQQYKLIKIEPQEPIIDKDKYGNETITYIPNHYKVQCKNKDNKYYIELKKKDTE